MNPEYVGNPGYGLRPRGWDREVRGRGGRLLGLWIYFEISDQIMLYFLMNRQHELLYFERSFYFLSLLLYSTQVRKVTKQCIEKRETKQLFLFAINLERVRISCEAEVHTFSLSPKCFRNNCEQSIYEQ